jgi:hypothetical protein
VSTASPDALAWYVRGIDRALAGNAGVQEALERAEQADEGFALAQIALAREAQFRGRVAEARERAARARKLAAGTTRRERQHVEAIAVAIDGNPPRSLELVRAHLDEFPRDAYVLSQANGVYGLIGFSGRQERSEEMFALLQSVAEAYGDDWWFLGAYSFAHHELYLFEEARRLVERSLALEPRNAHGSHSLAHIFYETGEHAAGTAFLDAWMPGYERSAALFGHLHWHHALFELAAGQYRRVLNRYDQHLRPSVVDGAALGALADAAALLWRCELYGLSATPLPWEEVRDFAVRSFPRAGTTWADLHCAIAFAASGDQESLQRLIGELRSRLGAGRLPAGAVVPLLVEGIAAYARGAYEETVAKIAPVAEQIVRVGGSNAQRELFEDTLLEALLRTGRCAEAEALIRTRLDRRPSARDQYRLGRACAARGAQHEAAAALRVARDAWSTADPDAAERAVIAELLGTLAAD